MFRSEDFAQSGFLSILYAQAQEPLAFWDKRVGSSGRIKRIAEETESEERLQCIELTGNNVNSTFITTPPPGIPSLGISLPVLVLIVKNLKRYFTYQVLILDDQNLRRRFRMTNIPGFNRRLPTVFTFPITLEEGWNELAANLSELCSRVYGTRYIETIRLEIHPNCKLREVFFCERSDAMKVRLAQPVLRGSLTGLPEPLVVVTKPEKKNNNNSENDRLKGAYKELANAVKSASSPLSKSSHGGGSARIPNLDKPQQQQEGNGRENNNNNTGSNSNNKTQVNLATRLKMEMYFEKPTPPPVRAPARQQQPESATTSPSSSSSATRKVSRDRKK